LDRERKVERDDQEDKRLTLDLDVAVKCIENVAVYPKGINVMSMLLS